MYLLPTAIGLLGPSLHLPAYPFVPIPHDLFALCSSSRGDIMPEA